MNERGRTFRVAFGLIDPIHLNRMGGALSTFLWCVKRQTDAEGNVLGGKRLTRSDISRETGKSNDRTGRYLALLAGYEYIAITHGQNGFSIVVVAQKKFRSLRYPQFPQDPQPADFRVVKNPEGGGDFSRGGWGFFPTDINLYFRSRSEKGSEQGSRALTRAPLRPVEISDPEAQLNICACGKTGVSGWPPMCEACRRERLRSLVREIGRGVPEVTR